MAGSVIACANRVRARESNVRPAGLWRMAAVEAGGLTDRETRKRRIELFRHAMIHAGYVNAPGTDARYPACPVCAEKLA